MNEKAEPQEAPPTGAGFYDIKTPDLEGLSVQVQRGRALGVKEPGLLGLGVIVGPDGFPRIILQLKHADGESLAAIMGDEDFGCFTAIMVETAQRANAVAIAAANGAGGKPS